MEFTFNLSTAQPYRFQRIDLFLYRFTSPNGSLYKIDFSEIDLQLPIIEFENYKSYEIVITSMNNTHKNLDENCNLTLIKIVRDFLNNNIRKSSLLIQKDHLLSQDIFELKRKLDFKKLNEIWLSDPSNVFYLVKEV